MSLNVCLETGPPLRNLNSDILTKLRFKPILLCVDIERVYLHIRINECERDILRFDLVNSVESNIIEILRFTKLVFGLTRYSFILEGTLEKLFENYRDSSEELIRIIENDMYADDLETGGNNLEKLKEIKQNSVQLFKKWDFILHK